MVASLLAAERIIAATYAHNQNYYQQSAKRSGGSVRHERYPSDRIYRTAASEMADLVNAASAVKQEAARLGQAFRTGDWSAEPFVSDTDADGPASQGAADVIARHMKRLVDAYNGMRERALAEDGYLARSVAKIGLDQAADGYRMIGIARGPNGEMVLDGERFAQALGSRFEETKLAVAGPFGLTEWLKRTAEQFDEMSPYAMLNTRNRDFQAFAVYRPASGLYLQLPVSGLLLDAAY